MGFSIHYRSTDSMHPAQAFAIKEDAAKLSQGYVWSSCEPVILHQQTDGFLCGSSKPNAFPVEIDVDLKHVDGVPDGTVLTLAEVLCELSRRHGVDWDLGHDYEPEPIGRIHAGIAKTELLEKLETFGSVGDLLDESLSEIDLCDLETNESLEESDSANEENHRDAGTEEQQPDEGPRVLKFPTAPPPRNE